MKLFNRKNQCASLRLSAYYHDKGCAVIFNAGPDPARRIRLTIGCCTYKLKRLDPNQYWKPAVPAGLREIHYRLDWKSGSNHDHMEGTKRARNV